ncbi:MAG TPA: hypothetical protein VNC50_00050, partial [Planctomycetia bacterium]|nr:hypothetical protein [Planctomycetia bacterium]
AKSIASRCAPGGSLFASRSIVVGEALAAEWTEAYPEIAKALSDRNIPPIPLLALSAPKDKVLKFVETRPELHGRWLLEALASGDPQSQRMAVAAIESDSDDKSRAALLAALAAAPPPEASKLIGAALARRDGAWQKLACDALARERRPLDAATVLAAATDPSALKPETRTALVKAFHRTPAGVDWTLRAVLGEPAFKELKTRRDDAAKLAPAFAALKKLSAERVFTFRAGGEVVGRYLQAKTTNPLVAEADAALKSWPARDRTALGVDMDIRAAGAVAAEKNTRAAFAAGCKSLGVSLDPAFLDRATGLAKTGRVYRAVQIFSLDLDAVLRESRFGRIEMNAAAVEKWEEFKRLFAEP